MTNLNRPLRVFLCHASGDKPAVKSLYERLVKDGIDAWLDKEKLIPGQNWQIEIPNAVKNSDVVIVCLSSQSVTKEGFVQKEIRFALDAADEKPDGTIFIIPARLENCDVPERMNKYHWVDLFSDDGYEWLLKALQIRADSVGAIVTPKNINNAEISNKASASAKNQAKKEKLDKSATASPKISEIKTGQQESKKNRLVLLKRNKVKAIISLILGILSITYPLSMYVLNFLIDYYYYGIGLPVVSCFLSLVGVIIGIQGLNSDQKKVGQYGILVSVISFALTIFYHVFIAY